MLTGFARALRQEWIVHVGWLTSLLGIFVMMDLTSFWGWAWYVRDQLQPRPGTLFLGLAVSSLYFLAASMVFPAEIGTRDEFDAHYMRHRRRVLGAVLVCNLAGQGWAVLQMIGQLPAWAPVGTAVYFVLLIATMVVSEKKTSIILLALSIADYLLSGALSFITPHLA